MVNNNNYKNKAKLLYIKKRSVYAARKKLNTLQQELGESSVEFKIQLKEFLENNQNYIKLSKTKGKHQRTYQECYKSPLTMKIFVNTKKKKSKGTRIN